MPIYEFKCGRCHEVFEVRQKMSDPEPKCSACGFDHTIKIPSVGSFVLKGTGWYQTDFKKK